MAAIVPLGLPGRGLMSNHKRTALFLPAMLTVALCFGLSATARAGTLTTSEIQVTDTSDPIFEADPIMGKDGFSNIAVYTSFDISNISTGTSQVYYQRLDDSALIGAPVLVSSGATNDQFNDISGDWIVYTAFISPTLGQIKVYEISTGVTTTVSGLTHVGEARIHGTNVVWVEGVSGAQMIIYCDLDDVFACPTRIAGPTPPATGVEIGDTFIVWESAGDIAAYDLRTGIISTSAANLARQANPATSGSWVVWQADDADPGNRIEALNLDTNESRVIVDNGFANVLPTIDGDIIAWESNASGNVDIYLYRLSAADTFQVTNHPADQFLNNVFGSQVAYVDIRTGTTDVFVTTFDFVAAEPDIDVTPVAIDFGSVELGTPAPKTVTLSNVGDADLTVDGISLQSGGSGDFMITSAPATPVILGEGGASQFVEITFTPSVAGDASDVLEISSDDPDEPLVQVPLSARGVAVPPLELIDDLLTFINDAVEAGTLTGSGPGKSAENRLNAFINMITNAGNLIEQGLIAGACDQLEAAFRKTDGLSGGGEPKDFVTGAAAATVADGIQNLRNTLGCL